MNQPIKYVEAMVMRSDNVESQLTTDDPAPPLILESVGTSEPISAQMERAGFLVADEVVILKLSDFRRMMERMG